MPDGGLAPLTVLSEQLPAAFGRTTPAQIVAFDFSNAHPLASNRGHDARLRMDGDLYIQRGPWKARVDSVVDQLHDGIGRGAVVGEERRRYLGREALANRDFGRAHGKRM